MDALLQRADPVGQCFREHGYDTAWEVGTVAAFPSFLIKHGARTDKVADVRNVDAQFVDLVAGIIEATDRDRIVKISSIWWIDREDELMSCGLGCFVLWC